MAAIYALSILAFTLGQGPDAQPREAQPPPSPPASAPVRPATPPAAAPQTAPPPAPEGSAERILLSPPRLVAQPGGSASVVPENAPALRLDRVSRCFDRGDERGWRAQCDATAKTCLVAPDAELAADGEPVAALDRAPPCVAPGWREQDLVPQGYRILPGLAETPPGWRRDERQRLMQVNFDLNRRIWLGAGYAAGGLPGADQGEATAGVRADRAFRWGGAPALARFRAFETYASFDGHHADFTLFGVDASRAYPSPLLRFTTFVGRPRRFDPPLYVGAWVEAIRAESMRTSAGWYDRTELGALALTADLWRSRDLSSFVRLRGGSGYEIVDQLTGGAFTPLAAADLDLTLDRGGFHHVRATAAAEWILPAGQGKFQPRRDGEPRLPAERTRLTGKAEYEVILLAVNDQPISAVLDGRAWKRDDVPGLPTGWELQATASLRFNLWAPPRRDAPVQDRL